MRETEATLPRVTQETESRVNAEIEPRVEVLGAGSELAYFKDLGWDGQPSRQGR